MRKLIPMLIILLIAGPGSHGQNAPASRPNNIKGGFYMKFGPSFPVGTFNTVQYAINTDAVPDDTLKTFDQPKIGVFGDFGYLIYLGPAFANNFLRAGIDATFFSIGYHGSHHIYKTGEDKIDFSYFFLGQKFGPVITVNPMDQLMIDLSWKLCLSVSEFDSDYGVNMTQQEFSLGLRYRIMAFSINYQKGKLNYNDFDKGNKEQITRQDMLKIMIGLKF
jgi:hypothetical protein